MAIELPDLVQRIRVRSDEVRAAQKPVKALAKQFDDLRASSSDASDSMDELGDSTDHYSQSADRSTKSTKAAVAQIRQLRQSSEDANDSIALAATNTDRLRTAAAGAGDDVSDLGDATEKAAGSTKKLGDETDKTESSQRRFGSTTRKNDKTLASFVKRMVLTIATIGALKIGLLGLVIPGAIAQLGDLLAAAAAGALALTSALAPLAGALAAVPAGILAIKSSTFVFGQLTAGVSDAVKAINDFGPGSKEAAEAVKSLSGNNRLVAESFAQLKFAFNDIVAAGRRAFLPEVATSLNLLTGLVPKLGDAFGGLSEVLGGLIERGARLVTSGPFAKDIQTILERNNVLVFTLGRAGLRLIDVLRNIMVAAGPMVQGFADLALKGAKFLDVLVASGRESGKLQGFFHDTLTTVKLLAHTLIDFGAGLFNILGQGRKLGDSMLDTLRENAREFERWTNSASGKNRIAEFFKDAQPVLRSFGKLVTALGKSFFDITNKVDTAPLLKQLRTDLLPVLTSLLIRTGKSGLTSAIIDLAVAFGKLLKALPINAIAELAKAVAKLVTAFVQLGKAHPIILQTVAALLSLRLAMKAISGFAKFTGIIALRNAISAIGPAGKAGERGLKGLVQGLRGAEGSAKKPLTLMNKLGKGIRTGLGKLKEPAQRAARGISTAIAEGVAKASGAVKKQATRLGGAIADGVANARGAVTKQATRLGGAITTGLSNVGSAAKTTALQLLGISKAQQATAAATNVSTAALLRQRAVMVGGQIKSFLLSMIGITAAQQAAAAATNVSTLSLVRQRVAYLAGAAATGVMTAAQWLLDAALAANPIGLVVIAIGALVAAFVLAWKNSETFRKIVTGAWEAIKTVIGAAVKFIAGIVKFYFNLYKTIIVNAFHAIVTVAKFWWATVKKVYSTAFKVIANVVKFYFNLYKTVIVNVFRAIKTIVSTAWNIIKTVFGTAFGFIKNIVVNGIKFVLTTWARIKMIWEVAKLIFGRVVEIVREKIQAVVDFVRGLKDRIIGFFGNAVDWLYNAGREIITGLIHGVESMTNPLQAAFGFISDKIPDWKGPIGKDEVLLYPAGRAIMRGLVKGINEGSGEVRSALDKVTGLIQVEDGSFVPPSFFGGVAEGMAGVVKDAIAEFMRDPGLPDNRATNNVKRTGFTQEAQKRLEKKAQEAAERENRLRLRLPLLKGADRREVKKQIEDAQRDQLRLTRRAGALKPVTDLRKERQAALRAADEAAKKARQLQITLPGLEGPERRKAKAEIERLNDERKDELQKAKDIQTQLIKAFNQLPESVQNLLNKLRNDKQEKAERQRRRERRQEREDEGKGKGGKGSGTGGTGGFAGGGGPTGSASDPVFSRLTPHPVDPEKAYRGDKGQRRKQGGDTAGTRKGVGRIVKGQVDKRELHRVQDRATSRVVRSQFTTSGKLLTGDAKNARIIGQHIDTGQRESRQAAKDARQAVRDAAKEQKQNIKELKAQNRADSKAQRTKYENVEKHNRTHGAILNGELVSQMTLDNQAIITESQLQTGALIRAIAQAQGTAFAPSVPPAGTGGKHHHPPEGDPKGPHNPREKSDTGTTVIFQEGAVVTNDPDDTAARIAARLRAADVHGRRP